MPVDGRKVLQRLLLCRFLLRASSLQRAAVAIAGLAAIETFCHDKPQGTAVQLSRGITVN